MRSIAERSIPSVGFLELEIVTGKLCPMTVCTHIPVRRIMRIPLSGQLLIELVIDRVLPCQHNLPYPGATASKWFDSLGKLRRYGNATSCVLARANLAGVCSAESIATVMDRPAS